MASFTYNPAPGEPEVTRTLGRTWVAGQSVDIPDDDKLIGKLRGNPYFSEGGKEPNDAGEPETAKAEAALEEKIDGRTKAAREARQKAAAAAAEAAEAERQEAALLRVREGRSEAEQRAVDRQRSLASAKADPDRDPSNPNGGAAAQAS